MSELMLISQVNEEIKQVQHIAQDLSLIAINAMLVARQAGDRAVGFGVVARELRLTSDRMAETMQGLSGLMYQLVHATAHGRNLERRMRGLCAAQECNTQSAAAIAPACRAGQRDRSDGGVKVRALAQTILGVVTRTDKQCAGGMVIARSAVIEAVYGGAMQPLLHQIAVRFEASIAALLGHIRALQSQFRGFRV